MLRNKKIFLFALCCMLVIAGFAQPVRPSGIVEQTFSGKWYIYKQWVSIDSALMLGTKSITSWIPSSSGAIDFDSAAATNYYSKLFLSDSGSRFSPIAINMPPTAVLTKDERDAIPAQMRRIGMIMPVVAEDSIYMLKGGLDNSNWVALRFIDYCTFVTTLLNYVNTTSDQTGIAGAKTWVSAATFTQGLTMTGTKPIEIASGVTGIKLEKTGDDTTNESIGRFQITTLTGMLGTATGTEIKTDHFGTGANMSIQIIGNKGNSNGFPVTTYSSAQDISQYKWQMDISGNSNVNNLQGMTAAFNGGSGKNQALLTLRATYAQTSTAASTLLRLYPHSSGGTIGSGAQDLIQGLNTDSTAVTVELNSAGKFTRYGTAAPLDGQVLIGGTSAGNYTPGTITAGSGVTITNGNGTITVSATGSGGTVTGSGTATQVAYWSGAAALTGSSNLFWDNSNTRLGVGTNTPLTALHVIENSTSALRGLLTEQYSNTTSSARIFMRKARGTASVPLVITTGDFLGSLIGSGYDGSAFVESGRILFTSTGTIGTGIIPSTMQLQTMTTGGTLTTGLNISEAQAITLPAYTTNGGLLFANGSGVLSQTGAGTSTTLLHGGTSPAYSAVSLTADITGILGSTNGGSGINNAGTLTWGSGGTLGTAAYTATSAYEVPLTFNNGLTRTSNTVTDDLITGKAGGLTAIGGTASAENLILSSTSNGTKGYIGITNAPRATANYGSLSIGSGAFDGSTAGFFTGSSSGTQIAVNAITGFTGNFIDLQKNGVSQFNINNAGVIGAGTWNGTAIGSAYGGAGTVNGLLKANGSGTVSAATAGTDYTTPSSTETQTNKNLTSATNTILHPLVFPLTSTSFSPADATIFYIGTNATTSGNSTAARNKVFIPVSGTIKKVYLFFFQAGVNGTSETSTIALRLNNTTDNTISSAITNDATTTEFSNTSMSIAVSAGDYFELKWTSPTWATNPTNVRVNVIVYME